MDKLIKVDVAILPVRNGLDIEVRTSHGFINEAVTFGEYAMICRRRAGLTTRELANIVGTSQPAISRVENDDFLGVGIYNRIMEALENDLRLEQVLMEARMDGA